MSVEDIAIGPQISRLVTGVEHMSLYTDHSFKERHLHDFGHYCIVSTEKKYLV